MLKVLTHFILYFQTVIKEDLPKKAKTLSSDSDKLLNEAKITQKKLQQGTGGVGGVVRIMEGLKTTCWIMRGSLRDKCSS